MNLLNQMRWTIDIPALKLFIAFNYWSHNTPREICINDLNQSRIATVDNYTYLGAINVI